MRSLGSYGKSNNYLQKKINPILGNKLEMCIPFLYFASYFTKTKL